MKADYEIFAGMFSEFMPMFAEKPGLHFNSSYNVSAVFDKESGNYVMEHTLNFSTISEEQPMRELTLLSNEKGVLMFFTQGDHREGPWTSTTNDLDSFFVDQTFKWLTHSMLGNPCLNNKKQFKYLGNSIIHDR